MPLYEHVFLTRQDASAQQVEELTAQFKAIVEQMGGKVAKTEQWGVKSLAYRLRKNRKAHFTLLNIDAPPAALNEIERQQRLSENERLFLLQLLFGIVGVKWLPIGDALGVRRRAVQRRGRPRPRRNRAHLPRR